MKLAPASKLITCILPKGHGHQLLPLLKNELGIVTATLSTARGGGRSYVGMLGKGEQTEKDLVNIVVTHADADAVFAWLYQRAGIGEAHGGVIFMHALAKATQFHNCV